MHRGNDLRCVEYLARAFRDSVVSSKSPSSIPYGQTRSKSRPTHGRVVQTFGSPSPALPHTSALLEYVCWDGWPRPCPRAACISTPAIIPSRHGAAK